jgi:hypothetical protein
MTRKARYSGWMRSLEPSMRVIPAYDAARRNPHWTACLVEGEFAVRYFDPKTNCVIGDDGKALAGYNDRVLVITSLADADLHCARVVEGQPSTGCLIYGASGVLVRAHVHPDRSAELAKPPSRSSHLVKGLLLLLGGTALMWWDWSRRWTIMIGVLLGSRMLIAAAMFLWRAIRGPQRSRS